MQKLMVRQFGGSDVAVVSRDATGQLRLEVLDAGLEDEIQALFDRLIAGPLPLRGGQRVETAGGLRYETTVRKVASAEPGFLNALSDALSREQVGGRRVRGILLEE